LRERTGPGAAGGKRRVSRLRLSTGCQAASSPPRCVVTSQPPRKSDRTPFQVTAAPCFSARSTRRPRFFAPGGPPAVYTGPRAAVILLWDCPWPATGATATPCSFTVNFSLAIMGAATLRHGRLRRTGRVRAPPSTALATSGLVRSAFPPPTKRPEMLGRGCPLISPARVRQVGERGSSESSPVGAPSQEGRRL
jgi:hypothetical protein